MRKTVTTLAIVVALVATSTLLAQPKRTPLDTKIKLVNDRRSTSFFSKLSVVIELPDISAAELSAVRLVVRNAVDDTGKTLNEPTEEEPQFFPVQRGGFGAKDPERRASFDLALLNPAREATTLKELSGEIDLYMPSRDPNAVASIPNVLSTAGKPVRHKVLKASGVSITVVTAQQREADKAKAVEARKAELKEQGYDDEDMSWMIEDFADMYYVPEESELALKVEDPDGRVQDLELIDAKGETVRAYPMNQDDLTVLSSFEPLGDDVGLRVNLRTPKTVSLHTFTIKDVPLP